MQASNQTKLSMVDLSMKAAHSANKSKLTDSDEYGSREVDKKLQQENDRKENLLLALNKRKERS